MGCSIKFVRLADFISDIDVLDLSTNGYSLQNDGYFQVAAPIGAKSVREVITLKLQGTSKDDLAAMTQEIDEKIKQVQWWMDDPGVERYQVWIRVQLDGETYPRQAQILNIQPPDKVKVFTPTEISANYLGEYQIGIERTPFWEDPYPYPTTTSKTTINCIGGATALSETINGDVPARLARFNFIVESGSAFNKFWLGWRTSRFGTVANFVPVWSLSSGSSGTDTTSASDSSAYGGTKLTCDFATVQTLVKRCHMTVIDASPSNPSDQRGTFTVLLRAKMSDTSIARARLGIGWLALDPLSGDYIFNNPIYRTRQVISGTGWNLYEMGSASFPPLKYFNSIVTLDNLALGIDAELISGSGSLDIDCFVLIPTNEGMIRVTSASDISSVSTPDSLTVLSTANLSEYGFKTTTTYLIGLSHDTILISPVNWGLPANGEAPLLVGAGQGASGSNKAHRFTISYTYIPRWRTLRGNVT